MVEKKPDYKLNTITFLLKDYQNGKVTFDYKTSGYDLASKKSKEEESQNIYELLSDATVYYLSLLYRFGIKLDKAIEMEKLINKQMLTDIQNYKDKQKEEKVGK